MDRRRKRIAAIGAAVALAVAGGGAAYAAAGGGNDHRDALLRDAAQRLNVTPGELRSALEGAFGDQLDQAVRAGQLTQKQADAIKARVRQHGVPLGGPLDGPGGPGRGPGGPDFAFGFGGPGHGSVQLGLDEAAGYLGLARAELARRLMNGRSLAQVARAEGKSVDGLQQALVDAAKARLDRAVADRDLTASQRDDILRELQEHVDDLVNGTPPGRVAHRTWRGGPGMPPPPPGGFSEHP